MTYKEIEDHFGKSEVKKVLEGKTTYTIRCEPWLNPFLNFAKKHQRFFEGVREDEIENIFNIFGNGFNDGFEMAAHLFER